MATIGNLAVSISANTAGLTRGLKSAGSQISGFASGFGGMLAGGLALGGGLLGISSAFEAVSAGIKGAADMEQAQVAFGVLLGNADTAKMVLADLSKFAAETPFEIPELTDAARSLAAFGFGAKDIVPNLRMVGDIASGIGQPVGEIAEIYGKARVQGRLFGEDINQLTGRGIPIIQELAKQFGVSESQVKKLVEQGKVGFPNLERAFQAMTSEGGKFNGMMAAQSQTLAGVWSTFTDTVGTALRDVATEMLNSFDFKALIEQTAAGVKSVGETITFGMRNAGNLFEIGLLEWQLMVAENVTPLVSPLIAVWEGAFAAFSAFSTNIKGGFTELGNFATAWGAGVKAAFDNLLSGEAMTGNNNPLQAFQDAFTKTLASQADAASAGNPLTAFGDAFQQSLNNANAGMTDTVNSLIAERDRLYAAIATDEQKRQQEIDRAAAAGAAAATSAGTNPGGGTAAKKEKPIEGFGALKAGSSEAFSAIFAAMRGQDKDPNVEVAKNTREQWAESKRQTAILRKQQDQPTIELVVGRV